MQGVLDEGPQQQACPEARGLLGRAQPRAVRRQLQQGHHGEPHHRDGLPRGDAQKLHQPHARIRPTSDWFTCTAVGGTYVAGGVRMELLW